MYKQPVPIIVETHTHETVFHRIIGTNLCQKEGIVSAVVRTLEKNPRTFILRRGPDLWKVYQAVQTENNMFRAVTNAYRTTESLERFVFELQYPPA